MRMTTREVLEAVAAGRMSPDEAAVRLAERDPGVALRRVKVRAATRTVRVVGDPGVSEVAVEGLHEVRREGDTLVVAAHPAEGRGGFAFVQQDLGRLVEEGRARARQVAQVAAREAARMAFSAGRPSWTPRSSRGGSGRNWKSSWQPEREGTGWRQQADWMGRAGWGDFQGWSEPLVIRVNPRFAVDADVSAGSLELTGVSGPVGVDVAFASANLDDLPGPIEVRAQASTVRIRGALSEGASRVRADAAAVFVTLAATSDVVVHSRCDLGRLRVSRGEEVLGIGEALVIGAGRASLDIEASMGAVEVRVEERRRP